jgi:uncharacterized protein involved in outer membrane biogenesis
MPLSRPLKLLSITVAAVAALAVVSTTLLLSFDWNRARPFINRRVSESLGRDFAIRGDLKLSFTQGLASEPGWRRYLPRPRIEASDVRLANAGWSSLGPQMVSARRISVALHPLALLRKEAVLTDVALEAPVITLERRADGSNNWTMKSGGNSGSNWSVEVQRLAFADGTLRYVDEGIGLDLRARLSSSAGPRPDKAPADGTAQQPVFGLMFELDGRYRDAPVRGRGKAGAVLQLSRENTVYPVQASVEIGKNKASVDGTLTDPRSLSGIDLQLALSGDSMADLYPLTGVLLPKTPAYATRGKLIGKKDRDVWNWTYRDFTGTVGESDLAGTLEYLPRRPRPLLRGAVTSRQLRLRDLGPSVGADGNEKKQARGEPPVQPDGKALPVEQFNPDKWGALDADVRFSGKKLVRSHKIPLQDIAADIHMRDKVLSMTPLEFGMADGTVTSNLSLDGRQHQIRAQIKLAARGLKVRSLFPKLQAMQSSFGEVNGDAVLAGRGNSVSAMLATANGELGATVSEGSVSRFILEAAGLNIPNAIFAKVFGDKQVHLNCMASRFRVDNGRAEARQFVIDTADARIDIAGSIDAGKETLDLDVRPQTKGLRIVSLRTPLYAKGSFEHPDIGPYKGPIALKAVAAGALALITPAAAILPLMKLGDVPDFDCASALAAAREEPKAAPAGVPAKPVAQADMHQAQADKRR